MTIISLFPCDIKKLLCEIEGLGFSLCLVGGASRDYKRLKTLSTDLDFEIRNQEACELRNFLKNKKIKFEELPYGITQVKYLGYSLEFSPPRIERQIVENKTHHHFYAELDKNLSYVDAFRRRDFTINAIGIELDVTHSKESIVDPYDGVQDLEKGLLREISDDFFLDSVRFLRLIRFFIKYDLKICDSIFLRLSEFDLSGLSVYHFVQEMKKSLNASEFISLFNKWVNQQKLVVPVDFKFWNEINLTAGLKSTDEILFDVFTQNEEKAKSVILFFSMPEKRLKDLKSFSDSFKIIKGISREDLKIIVSTPLVELENLELLKELKNLEEKKEWQPFFQESLPVSWKDWESVSVSESEMEIVPVKLRSYLRFYKALQKSFKV